MFHIWSLRRRYALLQNIKMPHKYIVIFDLLELTHFVATNIVYAFIWAFDEKYVYAYHTFLNIVVLISATSHFASVNRIVTILNCCDSNNNAQQIKTSKAYGSVRYAKRRILCSVLVAMVLVAANIMNII